MITSETHANRVQKLRAAKGLRGYSKAVRRFYISYWDKTVKDIRPSLPVNWNRS